MIDTKSYRLTRKKYKNIFLFILGRSLLQFLPFLIVLMLLLAWEFSRLIVLYGLIVFLVVGFSYLILNFVKNLEPFFSETHLEFDAETLQIVKNGEKTSWRMGELKNVVVKEDYWLVYVTRTKYVYIPQDIFHSDEDFKAFKAYINV